LKKTKTNNMEVNTVTKTTIKLSAEEVKEIIRQHLKSKGFEMDSYSTNIQTVYENSMDQYGTETFTGVTVVANTLEKKVEL